MKSRRLKKLFGTHGVPCKHIKGEQCYPFIDSYCGVFEDNTCPCRGYSASRYTIGAYYFREKDDRKPYACIRRYEDIVHCCPKKRKRYFNH